MKCRREELVEPHQRRRVRRVQRAQPVQTQSSTCQGAQDQAERPHVVQHRAARPQQQHFGCQGGLFKYGDFGGCMDNQFGFPKDYVDKVIAALHFRLGYQTLHQPKPS